MTPNNGLIIPTPCPSMIPISSGEPNVHLAGMFPINASVLTSFDGLDTYRHPQGHMHPHMHMLLYPSLLVLASDLPVILYKQSLRHVGAHGYTEIPVSFRSFAALCYEDNCCTTASVQAECSLYTTICQPLTMRRKSLVFDC